MGILYMDSSYTNNKNHKILNNYIEYESIFIKIKGILLIY